MKNREKIYLDTSVISAYFDNRMPVRQEDTNKFFKEILPNYDVYISSLTIKELKNVRDEELRLKFQRFIKKFKILKIKNDINELARDYIKKNIFPEKYFDDALHVAIASYYEISYLVSWNFTHLVKVRTRRLVNLVNKLDGVREIEIISPLEL